jgi:DNA-binding NarL/FixJ family response regulator
MPNSPVDHSLEFGRKAIIIIDGEPFSQDCLAEALRGEFPQMSIIGSSSVRDLYEVKDMAVEAVLLKIQFDSSDIHKMAEHVRLVGRQFPHAPVVVISPRDDALSIRAAILAGAQGLIPITASFKIAVAAVRLVLAGGTYYPHPRGAKHEMNGVIREVGHGTSADALPADVLVTPLLSRGFSPVDDGEDRDVAGFSTAFTAREVDVLAALRQGRSNKWIAHHLRLSENTIKVHIRHIMRKLHATNRTEAVVLSQNLIGHGSRDSS